MKNGNLLRFEVWLATEFTRQLSSEFLEVGDKYKGSESCVLA